MELFQLREPSDGKELPGLSVLMEPEPHVSFGALPSGDIYSLPLGRSLSEMAKLSQELSPDFLLRAADITPRKTDGRPVLIREKGCDNPHNRRRSALIHLDTAVGEGGDLILTGPRGAPELRDGDPPEVIRPWLPFNQAAGVGVLNNELLVIDDSGVVRWQDGEGVPFLVISLCRGASFRVVRTGDLHGAPGEFTVYWDGTELRTTIMGRRPHHRH